MKKNFVSTVSEVDICKIAKPIASALLSENEFTLWLKGPLGAGKTRFVKSLLVEMGLNSRVPVTSPTYVLGVDYDLPVGKIRHMDLYRLIDVGPPDETELFYDKDFRGMIIEWPDVVADMEEYRATHLLEIDYQGEDQRMYSFYSES